MSGHNHNAYDSARAGMAATGVVGSLTSGLGDNVPSHVANYAAGFAGTTGFDWSSKFHGFIMAGLLFFIGGPMLIYHFGQEHKWVAALSIPGVIVWSVGAFAYSIALVFSSFTYLGMKLKCRLYPVDEPNHTYGLSVTGNPLVDAIFITPFRLALYLIMLPFILVGSVLEVLRVILLNLAGKDHVSYRGDQGKYYEKVRKHYAKLYHQSGVTAAKDYLRMAYSGMLTPLGEEIPPSMWTNAHIEQWLAPMIHRHGPIEKYCKGEPGVTEKGQISHTARPRVVTINYTLTNDHGEELDSSRVEGREPLSYLEGAQNIIGGLENALNEKRAGDKLKVTVLPGEGYGEVNEELIQSVPRSVFEGVDIIEVGMQFQAQTPGGPQIVRVVEVSGETVTIDANHPLAGLTLHFDVDVIETREATDEEQESGHV